MRSMARASRHSTRRGPVADALASCRPNTGCPSQYNDSAFRLCRGGQGALSSALDTDEFPSGDGGTVARPGRQRARRGPLRQGSGHPDSRRPFDLAALHGCPGGRCHRGRGARRHVPDLRTARGGRLGRGRGRRDRGRRGGVVARGRAREVDARSSRPGEDLPRSGSRNGITRRGARAPCCTSGGGDSRRCPGRRPAR